ncbi:MAG: branched-chain amino acid ABC transporter permease [Acetobacteraceae bacterium]|nr:branched-chain amino acid ABC transporter permease [Acetobacteraceae bacterium]
MRAIGPAWRSALPWAIAAICVPVLPYMVPGGFGLSLLCRMGIAIVFALSFNMLLGQGGMLDFGHAVFLGLGGFLAMHAMRLTSTAWPAPLLPLAGAAGGLLAAMLAGTVATRRGGTAFAMITLGISELALALVLLFPSAFGGEEGINGDRSNGPPLFGWDFGPQIQAYDVIALWTWLSALLMWLFTLTPLGRLANAVRDNPERVDFLGYDPARIRLLVFMGSGLFAGVAGGLAALSDEIITSGNMSPDVSASVLVMAFIGGVGTFWGPILGAVLVTFLSMALSTITDAWQLYSGLLFMVMVVWAPGGLSGILLAHAPLLRAGRLGRVIPAYSAAMPGAVLVIAGVIGLAELGFRLQVVRNGGVPPPVLGLAADPHTWLPWAGAALLLIAGAGLLCRTAPNARAAWQAASAQPG